MARPKDPALRAKLLHAAAVEFAERGFGGASMSSIGRRAGVTKGGVYFHFRSKEELFFAAVDQWRATLRGALAEATREGSGARRLRAFVIAFLRSHFADAAHAALLRTLRAELLTTFTAEVRDDLRSVFRAVRAQLRELLVEGERDGSLYAHDPASSAFLLAAELDGVVQQWLASPREVESFCHPESVADAMMAPYLAGSAGPIPPALSDDDRAPFLSF